jgi:deoxycytidylate deaminase
MPTSSKEVLAILLGKNKKYKTNALFKLLGESMATEVSEYGRVVHAEMVAICDAARNGKRLHRTHLYTTTFPCHNCTKHIIAAGISKVTYLEPYPKSKAKELHPDEIEIERSSPTRVSFVPFLGISPYRYRDIFEKGSRKRDGKALRWIADEPKPLVGPGAGAYLEMEALEVAKLGGTLRK